MGQLLRWCTCWECGFPWQTLKMPEGINAWSVGATRVIPFPTTWSEHFNKERSSTADETLDTLWPTNIMENHHLKYINQLEMATFNSKLLVYQTVCLWCNSQWVRMLTPSLGPRVNPYEPCSKSLCLSIILDWLVDRDSPIYYILLLHIPIYWAV